MGHLRYTATSTRKHATRASSPDQGAFIAVNCKPPGQTYKGIWGIEPYCACIDYPPLYLYSCGHQVWRNLMFVLAATAKFARRTPGVVFKILKELRNFFCRFQGFVAFWGGHCCGAAYVYFECFSGFRADVSCCTTKIYLTSAIQTGRCGRICLFNLTVAECECKYRYCEVHPCCGAAHFIFWTF